MNEFIYLFHYPAKSKFCSGVFWEKKKAEDWIGKHRLSGVLTSYPIDTGVYDWAIVNKMFTPEKEHEATPDFIGGFSSASQEHWHYENGICEDDRDT
jgi:hypothetical protein